MKTKKPFENEKERINAQVEEEIRQAEEEPDWDLEVLAQCAMPDNMAIPLDAEVGPETYCRWTSRKNIDARRRREWRIINYKDGSDESGHVRQDDLVLMGRPQKLQEAVIKKRQELNAMNKVEEKVAQIDEGITILPGGPGLI